MKSLVALLMLSGALGLTAGCTPSESFCPNKGADAGGVCPVFGDDGAPPVQDMGMVMTGCPSGYQLETNPDGNVNGICVKIN
jgi:hypothetical protein